MIDSKELPAFKIFTHEPAQKKNRRHKRAEKEAKEVENINKMMEIEKEEKEKGIKTLHSNLFQIVHW